MFWFPRTWTGLAAVALLGCTWTVAPANATMVLQSGPANAGFMLSTFVSGFLSEASIGPLGIAFPAGGGVLVTDFAGTVYHFANDTDNQTTANANYTSSWPEQDSIGLTRSGASIYMTARNETPAGRVTGIVKLDDNGNYVSTLAGLDGATGIATNPVTGHLYSSATGGIYEVDPGNGNVTLFASGGFDGVTVSSDGKSLYAASGSGIQEFSTGVSGSPAAGTPGTFYDLGDSVDGTALGTGGLAGQMFVNTNSGKLYEVDLTTGTPTLFASGGSRGDFVAVDPNGTLLITQTDSVLRLTAPSGSAFETNIPEPASLLVLGFGIALLGGTRRRC